MNIDGIDKCKECGSQFLSWQPCMVNNGGVVDGRLRMSEVSCNFVLGCDDCSETVFVVSADKVAAIMTEDRR